MKMLCTVTAALAFCSFAFCQNATDPSLDYHLTADAAHALYSASAFAHGHRHGYEEGFHLADQDVHMGRRARSLEKVGLQGYRPAFGDKGIYQRGYWLGLRAGYDDSYNAREFRPTAEVLSAQLGDVTDQSLRAGYTDGLNASRGAASLEISANDLQACRKNKHNLRYCDGYALGFILRRDLGERLAAQNTSGGGTH
jgi:hypothetical protein